MKQVDRQILSLAIPSIIANITTPLLGMVDVAVTGHLGKAAYLAAIAVGGSMFNMLYWLFGFLRMGSSGMTAQAYGADDRRATDLILYRALLVAFIAGAIIIALQTPISGIVLRFMDPDPDTLGFATRYFEICVWGAPAVLGTYALGGWFLGMQNSRAQMWMSIVINLANIAVSLTLVYGFRLTIEGVATGTMTAQWLGLVTGLLICRRYRPIGRSWSEIADMRQLQRFFAVNTDIFLRTVCLVAVTVWFTRAGAQQGTVMLAVNALLMQLFMLFSFFMDGFAFAGEALCGRDVGRHDIGGLRRSIKALFSWGAGLALLFTLLYLTGGQWFLSLMSDDARVVESAGEYLWWAATIPIAGFAAFTWDGVFIGATRTRWMLISMAGATALFFTACLALFPSLHNHALWLAFTLYLAARGLGQSILARRLYTNL